ncbi:MAG: hypothetical protein AAFR52_00845 [Pseudomonadota bacterium]
MLKRLLSPVLAPSRNARAMDELYAFHRAEMREAGVTDAQLRAFLHGHR